MKIEDLKFEQKASQRVYNDYMKRIKKATSTLSKNNQDDIYMEFNSHIFETIQHRNDTNELDAIEAIRSSVQEEHGGGFDGEDGEIANASNDTTSANGQAKDAVGEQLFQGGLS